MAVKPVPSLLGSQGAAQRSLPAGVDMSVNVLTSGYWPSHGLIPATLPQELAQCSQVFSEFYLNKHSGRKLVWHNTLGTCIMKAQFKKGPKELAVSLFQVPPSLPDSIFAPRPLSFRTRGSDRYAYMRIVCSVSVVNFD